MANPEHVEILKQGVEGWNEWRRSHPKIKPDLSGAILNDKTLSYVNLSMAYLIQGNFDRAILMNSNFSYASLMGVKFRQADLSGSDMRYSDLRRVDLKGANLSGSRLEGTKWGKANLESADLTGASLAGADLIDADFRGANLTQADLKGVGCWHADFTGANLKNADLTDCWIGGTIFGDVDLSSVLGLATIDHHAPSVVGIDTVYKSKGNIPEAYLRGCGVPEDFIKYARTLVGKAIDYYSAFISYSSKDHDIAERLYTDLQSKGVRCWFAPEDMKIGDKFRQRIDDAIRIHDKLLVILSEESIASAWVEEEVEAAIEREKREKRLVLFPVRIDEAVIESNQAWAASLRRMRHIGDFSRWKDHDSYSKAFERLLRDLKADDSARGAM